MASPDLDNVEEEGRRDSLLSDIDVADEPPVKERYTDLAEANRRIQQLESKVAELYNMVKEVKVPKPERKFPDVSFLNYKNRKRILVQFLIWF